MSAWSRSASEESLTQQESRLDEIDTDRQACMEEQRYLAEAWDLYMEDYKAKGNKDKDLGTLLR